MYDDENAMRELDRIITRSQAKKIVQNNAAVFEKVENNIKKPIESNNSGLEKPNKTKETTAKSLAISNKKQTETQKEYTSEQSGTSKTSNKKNESEKSQIKKLYQFKITLEDTSPPVWRRIQVPESYTFYQLHRVINQAMGWYDCHMHIFRCLNPNSKKKMVMNDIGSNSFHFSNDILDENETKISDIFKLDQCEIPNLRKEAFAIGEYEYDMGDSWMHHIELESILDAKPNQKYPLCIDGKNACPPEDSGSTYGFANLKKIISNPKHPEYKEMTHWLKSERVGAGPYDPKYFDIKNVIFR